MATIASLGAQAQEATLKALELVEDGASLEQRERLGRLPRTRATLGDHTLTVFQSELIATLAEALADRERDLQELTVRIEALEELRPAAVRSSGRKAATAKT